MGRARFEEADTVEQSLGRILIGHRRKIQIRRPRIAAVCLASDSMILGKTGVRE